MATQQTPLEIFAKPPFQRHDDQFDFILGHDIVRSLEGAVRDAFIASQLRAEIGGEVALDTLLVMLLASVIGAPERLDACEGRTAAANELLVNMVAEMQNQYRSMSPDQFGTLVRRLS